MSDTKLRELERRWKETGGVDDEAAYLLERVRVGDLTQERLELAAYCGHEGARAATGVPLPAAISPGLNRAVELAPEQAQRLLVSIAAKVARAVLRLADHTVFEVQLGDRVLESVEQWLSCPCEPHRKAVHEFAEDMRAHRTWDAHMRPTLRCAWAVQAQSPDVAVRWSTQAVESAAVVIGNDQVCSLVALTSLTPPERS